MSITKRYAVIPLAFMLFASLFVMAPAYADTELYNESGGASSYQLRMGNTVNEDRLFAGEEITASSSLIGLEFNRVSLEMLEVGTPTGTVVIGLWNSTIAPTQSNYICFIGAFDASIIRFQPSYTFTGNFTKASGSCTFQANTALGIYYGATGSTGNLITLRRSTVDVFDGTNTYATRYDHVTPAWGDLTTADMNMRVYLVDSSSQGSALACIDLNGDGTTDVCYTDTNGDGIADSGNLGAIGVVTNQNPIPTALGRLGCQIGFIAQCSNGEPTNTDIQDNGIGIIMFLIIWVVIMAVVGSALYGRIKVEYHLMVHVAILMIAVGISTSLEYIDIMWFYIMIFIVIGFSSVVGARFVMSHRGGSGGD